MLQPDAGLTKLLEFAFYFCLLELTRNIKWKIRQKNQKSIIIPNR